MKIAIWKTGHEIADTVAVSVAGGLVGADRQIGYCTTDRIDLVSAYDAHIGYGILRGTDNVFRQCDKLGKPYFNLDRGYFRPGHYSGYYRVSLRGTQHTQAVQDWMLDDTRWRALGLEVVKPWRGFDATKPVLVCPPTTAAMQFFSVGSWPYTVTANHVIREKGDAVAINFSDYNYVLTFNSSVGWQALAAGIPCVSDPVHSMVGAWFKNIPLDQLAEKQLQERHKLFSAMSNLQLTLDEMKQGMLWPLMSSLLSHDQPS